jgi:hypothetical protein
VSKLLRATFSGLWIGISAQKKLIFQLVEGNWNEGWSVVGEVVISLSNGIVTTTETRHAPRPMEILHRRLQKLERAITDANNGRRSYRTRWSRRTRGSQRPHGSFATLAGAGSSEKRPRPSPGKSGKTATDNV